MKDTINALVELQHIDDDIRLQQIQRDELSANLTRLQAILAKMSEELTEKQEKLTEATRFYTDKQLELRIDGERLSKAKSKLATVTRTKEYAAMQRELDSLRRKYSDDEVELKRLAGAIEEYKSSISSQEANLNELQEEVSREQEASSDRLRQLDGEISKIATRKEALQGRLDDGLYRRYLRILDRREGKAVVPAVGGKCTGCQMRLPPQQFILVQRQETLEACASCQRFLHFMTEDEYAEGQAQALAMEDAVGVPAEVPAEVAAS